jgi:hypothetical protein
LHWFFSSWEYGYGILFERGGFCWHVCLLFVCMPSNIVKCASLSLSHTHTHIYICGALIPSRVHHLLLPCGYPNNLDLDNKTSLHPVLYISISQYCIYLSHRTMATAREASLKTPPEAPSPGEAAEAPSFGVRLARIHLTGARHT